MEDKIPETKNFYSVEYTVDGEVDIKHVFMTSSEMRDLQEKFHRDKIKYKVYILSKPPPLPNVMLEDVHPKRLEEPDIDGLRGPKKAE